MHVSKRWAQRCTPAVAEVFICVVRARFSVRVSEQREKLRRSDSRISGDAKVRIGTGARDRLLVPSQRGRKLARFPVRAGLRSRAGTKTHGRGGVLVFFGCFAGEVFTVESFSFLRLTRPVRAARPAWVAFEVFEISLI